MERKAFRVDAVAIAYFCTWNNTVRTIKDPLVISCNGVVIEDELPAAVRQWLLDNDYEKIDYVPASHDELGA